LVDGNSLFAGALEQIEPGTILEGLQAEFAALCNRLIVADQRRVRNKYDLRAVVRKACATISIGLEAAAGRPRDATLAARLMRRHSLADIFRVGFGRPLRLKWRAGRWLPGAWFKQAGLPLTFWDEAWTGVLGGLLVKKPLCYDPTRGESVYREFESTDDIRHAEDVLGDIIAVDSLLAGVHPVLATGLAKASVSYKNLLLTVWVLDWLGHPPLADGAPVAAALPMAEFRTFYRALFPDPPGSDGMCRVPEAMRIAFLTWLASVAGVDHGEVGERAGAALARLFDEIEEEYGRVAVQDLAPRFVRLFLIAGGGDA
jgi:hypothetical protein